MKLLTPSYRMHRNVVDMDLDSSVFRRLAPRRVENNSVTMRGLAGQPLFTGTPAANCVADQQTPPAPVAQARQLGYSVPWVVIPCNGGAACIRFANADCSYTTVVDYWNYPPTHWTPQNGINADGSFCNPYLLNTGGGLVSGDNSAACPDSFRIPPRANWDQMMQSLGPEVQATIAYNQQTNAAAIAQAQSSCAASGGVWDPANLSCNNNGGTTGGSGGSGGGGAGTGGGGAGGSGGTGAGGSGGSGGFSLGGFAITSTEMLIGGAALAFLLLMRR